MGNRKNTILHVFPNLTERGMKVRTYIFVLLFFLVNNCFAQTEVKPIPSIPTKDSNFVELDNFAVVLMPFEHRVYFRIFNDKGEEAFSEQEINLINEQSVRNTIEAGDYLITEIDSIKLGFKIATADTLTHQFKTSIEYLWNYPNTRTENYYEDSADNKNLKIKYLITQNGNNKIKNTFGLNIVNVLTKDTMIIYYCFLEIHDYFLDIKFQKGIYNISVQESVYSSDKFRFMKISESERIPIISPRNFKKFEIKKNRKKQMNDLFKSY